MRRLIDRRGQERGAVAVIVALVVSAFVLTGVAALTVDAGSLYAERRVVQNAADAASLALAQACAQGVVASCSPSSSDLSSLADLNSPDGLTAIDSVCGSVAPFASCGALPVSPTLVQCDKLPSPAPVNWVEVRTKTLSTGPNSSVVPGFFANLSDPSYHGTAVKACARTAWGPIGTYTASVPIALSLCMFDALVGGTTNLPAEPSGTWPGYGPAPGHVTPWPSPSPQQVEDTTKYAGTCANSNGHTANGSFAWLTSNACLTSVTTGGWVQGDPGNNEQCNMAPYWGTKILVPIFDCIQVSGSNPGAPPPPGASCSIPTSGGGSNIWFHISGWASFYLSGYRFPSDAKNSVLTGLAPCTAPASCMGGWLTKLTLAGASLGGGTNYGVSAVQVAG
jgi:hypothetical protein